MRLFAFDANDVIHDRKQGEPPVEDWGLNILYESRSFSSFSMADSF